MISAVGVVHQDANEESIVLRLSQLIPPIDVVPVPLFEPASAEFGTSGARGNTSASLSILEFICFFIFPTPRTKPLRVLYANLPQNPAAEWA